MDKTIITLQIGSKKATINGEEMTLDAPPFIVSGRTVVPLRFVSEGLGAKVEWDGVPLLSPLEVIWTKQSLHCR